MREKHGKKGGPRIIDKATLKLELVRVFHDSPSGTFKTFYISKATFDDVLETILELRLKFNYNTNLQALLVQMQSQVHGECIHWLTTVAMDTMSRQRQKFGDSISYMMDYTNWKVLPGFVSTYLDSEGGRFVADLSFCGKSVPSLYCEVTFSQPRQDVLLKVARMLEDPCVIGVIIIHIDENPKYESPSSRSTQFHMGIDRARWERDVEGIKNVDEDAFVGINLYGLRWAGTCKCSVQVVYKSEKGILQSEESLPASGPIVLTQLNALLQRLWADHVHASAQICGVVHPSQAWDESIVEPLAFNFSDLRRAIARGISLTGCDRFVKWRDSNDGPGGAHTAVEVGGDNFKLKRGRFKSIASFNFKKWMGASA